MFDGVRDFEKSMLCPRLMFEGSAAVCDGAFKLSGGGLVNGHSDEVVCGWWHVDNKVFSPVLELRCISISQFVALLVISYRGVARFMLIRLCLSGVCPSSPHHASSGHVADQTKHEEKAAIF